MPVPTSLAEVKENRVKDFLSYYVRECGGAVPKTEEELVDMLLAFERTLKRMWVERLATYEKLITEDW